MIRVLIIDDSSAMRMLLSATLRRDPGIEVIGTASDPYEGRDKIVALKPDVVTLDIEMPKMDGLTFLGKLMRYYPLPVIIVSTLTQAGSETAIRALELGAVDVVCKPASEAQIPAMSRALTEKIHAAAGAHLRRGAAAAAPVRLNRPAFAGGEKRLVAIGASTGGTEAIASILRLLPENTPPTVIVQHMPEYFTTSFAARLNSISALDVHEAQDGEPLREGVALLAPGDFHLLVVPSGDGFMAQVRTGPAVFHQRPSVDVLFNSVVKCAERARIVAALLTGMGADGAAGLLALRRAGAYTLAQDEASCVVYGMPRAAAELGAAVAVQALDAMPQAILNGFSRIGGLKN